jgi:hypothetical protein
MTTPVRWAFALAVALVPALVLPGCGDEPAEESTARADTAAVAEEPAVLVNPAGPVGDSTEPIPVTLEPVNESGVEGRATQIEMGDSVQMSLMVQGLPKDGDYAAHIHRGTCVTGGEVVLTLNPVKAESDGMGRSLTKIPANRISKDEPHFVQVHGSSGVLACGDVHGS